jgi:hypothetical protein
MRPARAASLLVPVAVAVALLGGCSVPEQRTDAVSATAERFARSTAAHDMAAACALLASTLREELADEADENAVHVVGQPGLTASVAK